MFQLEVGKKHEDHSQIQECLTKACQPTKQIFVHHISIASQKAFVNPPEADPAGIHEKKIEKNHCCVKHRGVW